MKSLFKNAKKSIDIITNEEGLNELHNRHLKVLKSAKKSGVKIRILTSSMDGKHAKALSSVAEINFFPNGKLSSDFSETQPVAQMVEMMSKNSCK